MTITPEQVARALSPKAEQQSDGSWKTLCPCHDDKEHSLHVSAGKKQPVLVTCHAGCPSEDVIAELKKRNLWGSAKPRQSKPPKGKLVQAYDYTDEQGKLLYQSVRFESVDEKGERVKTFRLRQRDPEKPTDWLWNTTGLTRVPYRLPEVVKAREVFIVEGEKDAERLASLGLTATTNSEGAGKWKKSFNKYLANKAVVLLPDNDDPGRDHVKSIAEQLLGTATSIRVVTLPDLPPKGDVSDWLDAGNDVKKLLELSRAAPDFESDEMPPESQAAVADQFVSQHGEDLRFDHEQGEWYRWEPPHWHVEPTTSMFGLVRKLCRKVSKSLPPVLKKEVTSASFIAAVIKQAASYDEVKMRARWDADHWLLNTPGGVTDLRTGELRPHSRDLFMTKITSVTPAVSADCSRFLDFLCWACCDDADYLEYLRRALALCMTGDASIQQFWFLYGNGGGGKDTLCEVFKRILGTYAGEMSADTLTMVGASQHKTFLAQLRGLRMVTCAEIPEEARWNTSIIKSLTGGNKIPVNFMRQDTFNLEPTFKILPTSNHLPEFRTIDKAIRRRLRVWPFNATLNDDAVIEDFAARLVEAEGPAILRWALDALAGRGGQTLTKWLAPPPAVLQATSTYLDGADTIGTWFEDHCELDPLSKDFITGDALFRDYSNHASSSIGSRNRQVTQDELLSEIEKRWKLKSLRRYVDGKRRQGFVGLKLCALHPYAPGGVADGLKLVGADAY